MTTPRAAAVRPLEPSLPLRLSPGAPGGLQLGHLPQPRLGRSTRRQQHPAHRRHRLGQIHARRRRHHPARAAAESLTTRRRARTPGSARCARMSSATTSPNAASRALAPAGRSARRQQLLRDPRALHQRGLRPDRHARPGLLAQGLAGAAGAPLRRRAMRAVDRRALRRFRHRHRPAAKRLRKAAAEVVDTFPPYGAAFRRRFGIENEQALDLFHQTVSMKSVGNLTDFVREHMLEPSRSSSASTR